MIGLPNFKANTDIVNLEKIIRGHIATFIYQNSVLYNEGHKSYAERTIPSLEKDIIFEQMVLKKQPGYCFQQLELMAAVLEACGFNVSKYLAKIILKPAHQVDETMLKDSVISHEIIMVNLGGIYHLVDVGMANSCLRKPLPFAPGEQLLGSEWYRLTQFDQEWRLDVKSSDGWFSLYQFHQSAVPPKAIIDAHQNIYQTPKPLAIRDDKRITGKTNDEKRKVVAWFSSTNKGFFKSQKFTGESKEQPLENFNEASELAKRKFGIPL